MFQRGIAVTKKTKSLSQRRRDRKVKGLAIFSAVSAALREANLTTLSKNMRKKQKSRPLVTRTSPLLRRWRLKFSNALRGIVVGIRNQNSYCIHFPAVLFVVAIASWLRVSQWQWLALILCITLVFSAELFNSALEHMARAITREENPEIRDALDVASGAVLVASIGAAVVGLVVLVL